MIMKNDKVHCLGHGKTIFTALYEQQPGWFVIREGNTGEPFPVPAESLVLAPTEEKTSVFTRLKSLFA